MDMNEIDGKIKQLPDQAQHELYDYIDFLLKIHGRNREKKSMNRPFGLCKGEFHIPDDFNAPLPEHILNEFEGK